MLNIRFSKSHVEDFLTIRHPIIMAYSPRSHRVLIVWDLEPTELSAKLP